MAISSQQMETSANAIAVGASEQANAINHLNDTMVSISNNVKVTDDKATSTANKAKTIGENAKLSNEKMNNMVIAMQRITDSSRQIAILLRVLKKLHPRQNYSH